MIIGNKNDYAVLDYEFIIFSVSEFPDDAYYRKVAKMWSEELWDAYYDEVN